MLRELQSQLCRRSRKLVNVPNCLRNAVSSSKAAVAGGKLDNGAARFNPIGIQMLSGDLHRQVFGDAVVEVDPQAVERGVKHLKAQQLWGHETTALPDVSFALPELLGSDLEEHFTNLGHRYARPYRQAAESLSAVKLPPLPREWNWAPGWTKYGNDGRTERVDCPDDEALVFDVEVCVKEGHFPTLATAASKDSWYSWCSAQLTKEQFKWKERVNIGDLIPLEARTGPESVPRVVVGHNVGFDRSFLREQYFIQGSQLRFLDTLSLHVCVSGLTGLQRALSMANKSEKAAKGPPPEMWQDLSSLNNLGDVYALYSGGKVLKKEARDTFLNGSLGDIAADFQGLMTYCANDVLATHEVLSKLLPLYFERFPHPISFAGMLEMSTAYLPVNQNWERYLSDAEAVYQDVQQELKQTLAGIANSACRLLHGNAYKRDPWLWDLDWSVQNMRCKKSAANKCAVKGHTVVETQTDKGDLERGLEEEVKDILKTSEALYKTQPFLSGYPAWYRDFCVKPPDDEDSDWEPGPSVISTQMRSVPKLLRLKWDGYPLHFDMKQGWGYLVPREQKDGTVVVPSLAEDSEAKGDEKPKFPLPEFLKACGYEDVKDDLGPKDTGLQWQQLGNIPEEGEAKLWRKVLGNRTRPPQVKENLDMDVDIDGCYFFRLPHKDGPHKRVGNPLAKDFLTKVTDGILQAGDNPQANRVLLLSKIISYWKNARDRIASQMVVWFTKSDLPEIIHDRDSSDYGVILPRLIPAGTVTRRAVEPTWLTASNAYKDRVGSELKSMVQAPKGYHIVGADVDSQELWIASILADAHFAEMHGCTAIGWMTLQGNKAVGTDMHSRTATSVGISRDQAKVINYARIYGAGQPFAQRLLMQFNHRLDAQEASTKAKKMYAQTKGVRVAVPEVVEGQQVFVRGKRKVWEGGSESHMFNKLEAIADSEEPRTPVLGCRISRALEPAAVDTNFFNSRINWVVQSSAVDYLHLMLITMRWLMDDYAIQGRFAVSIHDEVRFLVASEDRYRAALALQVTNLLTRAFFAWKLGMRDLPQSVAFFSSVEVDTVLRKEVDMDCVTPSNPHGLKKGYGIPAGEALDIYAVLEKTEGGRLGPPEKAS
ncbi:DNA polymerase subunit gamma-1 [Ixodes scapularis]|nr:DNA polymerase subunit gamma-1 [Ixodes scapularis]